MATDIEHINSPVVIIQLDQIENVASDFIAGFEKPGDICPLNDICIVRQQAFLDIGGSVQVLLDSFLLPDQVPVELVKLFFCLRILKYQLFKQLIVYFMVFNLGPGFQ